MSNNNKPKKDMFPKENIQATSGDDDDTRSSLRLKEQGVQKRS